MRRVPLELVTLLALSSIPLVLGIVNCAANLRAARKAYARVQVHKISSALAKYRERNGRCPTTRDDIFASEDERRHAFTDPWRDSIAYRCSDAGADVRSAGWDGIFNTPDDIEDSISWEP